MAPTALLHTLLAISVASQETSDTVPVKHEHSTEATVEVPDRYDDNADHPYFIEYHGFIADGADVLQARMTPEQANEACASMPKCKGFTFQKQCSPMQWDCEELIYFKEEWNFIPSTKSAYVSYKRVWSSSPPWASMTPSNVVTVLENDFENDDGCVESKDSSCGTNIKWHIWGSGVLFTQICWLCFACLWKSKVVNNLPQLPDKWQGKEDRAMFDFVKDEQRNPWQCIYACCCTPAVAAKNYEVSGVCAFWPAYFCLSYGMVFGYPLVVATRAFWSMKLKERMGIETNCFKECCLSWFCFPCEVGRESQEVDEELGVIIGAPFQVTNVEVEIVKDNDIDSEKRFCTRNNLRFNCGN